MSDQLVLILVIIGGVIGLALVGVAIWMMRSESPAEPKPAQTASAAESQPQTETALAPQVEATPPSTVEVVEASSAPLAEPDTLPSPAISASTPAPVSTSATPSWLNSLASRTTNANATLSGGEELVRLWRSADGELIVEVSGKRYRTRQELIDAGLELRVASAARDLSFLLESPANATVSASAIIPPHSAGAPSKTAPRLVTKVSLEEAAKMEVKRPSMDLPTQFRYLRSQQKQPEIQIKTVAEEIDEILQVMILGTPFVSRGLKVSDSPHGVSFSIDNRNYESVDSIPDGDAQNLIRAAIQKWDQK